MGPQPRNLFLARDRLGVKPLHYALLPSGHLIFGSELKSLTVHPEFKRDLDPFAIEEYFALGYVPEPRTIYTGRTQASAGAYADDPARGKIPKPANSGTSVHARQSDQRTRRRSELVDRLRESVKLRMIAEVPLGAFLSAASTRAPSLR
jgi:asparagine synthase (glutamine-hydrolysing)